MLFANKTNGHQQQPELTKVDKIARLMDVKPSTLPPPSGYKVQLIWHLDNGKYLGGASACVTTPDGHYFNIPLEPVGAGQDAIACVDCLVRDVHEYVTYLSLWQGSIRSEEASWERLKQWIGDRDGQTDR